MQFLFTGFLYILALFLLVLSGRKDRARTVHALKKARKMFISILPQFISIVLLVGLVLSVFDDDMIRTVIGTQTGVTGIIISALVGAISLIPVLIAFPIASELLSSGAGLMQIAVFVSALTTVGIITMPIEIRFLGRKTAVLRNTLFFLSSFVVAIVIKAVLT